MAKKDDFGRAGEDRAAEFLLGKGMRLLDRNWRCSQGEIDIVALDKNVVVVIEVKSRRSVRYGHPLEAIDERKRSRLWRLGMAWLASHPGNRGCDIRIDAIAIVGDDPQSAQLEHMVGLR